MIGYYGFVGIPCLPYRDMEQTNLDWLVTQVKSLSDQSDAIAQLTQDMRAVERQVATNTNTINTLYGRVQNLEAKALPTVTDADNGKVLQVVSGAWTAVNLDGNNISY